jgi:tetratricopeptide (TPR) repeat protein
LPWNNKGISLNNLDKYDEAIQAYDEAIMLDPGWAWPWNNKGVTLENQGKLTEALKCFDTAIRIYPEYANAWENKGVVLEALGRTNEANAAFAKARDLISDGESMLTSAEIPSSPITLPSYSQVVETYPEGTELCCLEANITDQTEETGLTLSNIKCLPLFGGDIQFQCYGAKLTLDVPITIDGKRFDVGAKLTVDKDLHWIQVSSWD